MRHGVGRNGHARRSHVRCQAPDVARTGATGRVTFASLVVLRRYGFGAVVFASVSAYGPKPGDVTLTST
jgi:hypothetical protein